VSKIRFQKDILKKVNKKMENGASFNMKCGGGGAVWENYSKTYIYT
jgi:hypothetical protein